MPCHSPGHYATDVLRTHIYAGHAEVEHADRDRSFAEKWSRIGRMRVLWAMIDARFRCGRRDWRCVYMLSDRFRIGSVLSHSPCWVEWCALKCRWSRHQAHGQVHEQASRY
jgi:hypothetical protein